MASEGKTVGKLHFQHQDKANTQSRIMIANHAARSSKKVGLARELGSMNDSGKEVQNIQGMLNNQMDGVSKHQHNDLQDCQSVQDPSRNQIDEASNQNDIELQGSTSRITFNNNPHVENDFMDEESDQDVDSESESLDAEKKTRGPTFMKEIWGRPSTLPRIKIQCDDMGRPIGSRRNKFTDFLGTLARNGKFCPIDVEDWHKMPLDSKKKMLDVIKEKYDLPPGTESWTLRSIGTKWRNWKSELKKKYYDPELPMQVLLEERDKRAFVEQYVKLVAQWNSEKSKERSEKNKIARNQKIMNQTTGRRYFAQVQQKLKKEKGRPPSRVELFMLVSLMLMEVPQATLWQKNWLQ
ncbi:uncharacterized protein [Primulina eburnea]|uniref:uncharacterized protein isoform X11 n=1 Tax=Primulina eburnea TaxID=1245227 RepID=UPI003C6CA59D